MSHYQKTSAKKISLKAVAESSSSEEDSSEDEKPGAKVLTNGKAVTNGQVVSVIIDTIETDIVWQLNLS